jgi:putative peptidoglycan lipid II flippase
VSVSLGALVNAALLLIGLRRRGTYVPRPGWVGFSVRLALALLLMTAVLVAAATLVAWTRLPLVERAFGLAATIAAAMAVYFAALWLLGFRPRDFMQRAP